MSFIQVAHVRVQGVDFVFVPLSSQIKAVSPNDRQILTRQAREICRAAGLGGEVVIVWSSESGVGYLADSRYHAMLSKTLTLTFLKANLNKRLNSPGVTGLLAQLSADPFAGSLPPLPSTPTNDARPPSPAPAPEVPAEPLAEQPALVAAEAEAATPANDAEPVVGPTIKPVVIGQDVAAPVERKRGWWRR